MALAWEQMTQTYGAPYCTDGAAEPRAAKVAVAGYGKLGGLELGYGSDLDLVFLHDSSGEVQQTNGERPLDNGVFFLRLGQAHRTPADHAFGPPDAYTKSTCASGRMARAVFS